MERRLFVKRLSLASLASFVPFETISALITHDDELLPLLEQIIGKSLKSDIDLAQKALKDKFPQALEPNYYANYFQSQTPEIKAILKSGDKELESEIRHTVPRMLDTAKSLYANDISNITDHPLYHQHLKEAKSIAKRFHKAGSKPLRKAIKELKKESERFKGKSVPEIIRILETDQNFQQSNINK